MELSTTALPTALSAKGTRLNRRGRETRQLLLREAVQCLAEGGPDAVSANAVARRAGATWGTIHHQFGDADGLWAAVLDHIAGQTGLSGLPVPNQPTVAGRVEAVVDLMWFAVQQPSALAFYQLRANLPHRREQLEQAYPRTARAIARWDEEWAALCERSFAGLGIEADKLMRVRHLLPGALRGLYVEGDLGGYVDVDEGRRGLRDALTSYLRG
ncbi:TetR family transcriptional regulator [Nocardioides sp. J9]|uniref:TetR/AcrR family transcriptional regulator n=1 Tax=Nocardioides sp. J9 TaxID=935844 RepID=UPI00119FABA6|nr:TetR/AcrR family transcriptional regulator [Nocardioides sp. J9]TWG95114.1 TetR family transcriptional regulator [Nocardioides sp. J9]